MKKFLTLILSFMAVCGYAQDYYLTTVPNFPSAQAYSMVRYGNTPVSYYTGTATLNIPIFEYKDEDFTIPLSLGYAANSFKPQAPPSVYGLNWFLNVGGVITREVRGVPDDVHVEKRDIIILGNDPVTDQPGFTGFLVRDSFPDSEYSNMDVLNDKGINHEQIFGNRGEYSTYGYGVMNGKNLKYVIEMESDIYHFNFMGYKGSFIIDGNLKPVVFNTDAPGEFKVDLKGLTIWNGREDYTDEYKSPPTQKSSITITTGDGYRYTFGGELSAVDYTGGIQIKDGEPKDVVEIANYLTGKIKIAPNWCITSWYLTEIKAPNGHTVTFEYDSKGLLHYGTLKNIYICMNNSYEYIYSSYKDEKFSNTKPWNTSLLGVTHLTEVRVNGSPIYQFNYDNTSTSEIYSLLTSIVIPNNMVTLEYDKANRDMPLFLSRDCHQDVHLLKKINVPGQGVYNASYHNSDKTFPRQDSPDFDHWGYWNGTYTTDPAEAKLRFAPCQISPDNLGQDNNEDQVMNESASHRAPGASEESYSIGLLKTITYPTGGSTTFEYEQHTYTNRVDRKSGKGFIPVLYPSELKLTGGARIKTITDADSLGGKNTRKFVYTPDSLWNPGSSSGNLLQWPRYYLKFISSEGAIEINVRGSSMTVNSFDNTHIEYGKVYEQFSDGSYIAYKYSNYNDQKDDFNENAIKREYYQISDPNSNNFFKYNLHPVNSNSIKRGQLLSKQFYGYAKNLLKEEKYNYINFEYNKTAYNLRIRSNTYSGGELVAWYFFPYAVNLINYKLYSVTTKEYANGQVYEMTKEMMYNTLGQLAKTSVRASDESEHSVKNTYVKDLSDDQRNTVHQKMVSENVIGYPLETIKTVGGSIVGGQINEFQLVNNNSLIRLHTVKSINPPTPSLSIDPSFLDTQITFQDFDDKGKVIRVEDKDGTVTNYIWGYEGLYPVAKIVGGLSEEDVVRKGLRKDLNLDTDDDYCEYFKKLRQEYKDNPEIQIYSYTYKWMVGITSQTDPSGRTIYYTYDNKGRLSHITDENDHVIEKYDYNVKNDYDIKQE